MAVLTLSLLGPPLVRSAERDLRLPSLKAQALLYYLASQPVHVFTRSHLCALLWEDSSEAEGRNSLSTTLSRLRQSLPLFPLLAEGDQLAWRATDEVWVDTQVFGAVHPSLAEWRTVADLWRGPFLDGFMVRDSVGYDEWLRQMRSIWEQRYLTLLWQVGEDAAAAREWATVQDAAHRALVVDSLQERFHRSLMAALYQTGDRAAALAQYDQLVRVLTRELGAAPDPATVRLLEAIRDGSLARAQPRLTRRPGAPLTPQPVPAPALPLLERQAELTRLEEHLRRTEARRPARPASPAQLVMLEGEAGIGKSRLLAELVWRLGQNNPAGWTVVQGHCYEAERSFPYHPLIDALTPLVATLDLASLDLPDVWLAEVARLLPDLAAGHPAGAPKKEGEQGQDQRRLFEGVARFMAALPQPLLVLLDDLHWADAATLQLLAYLVRHLDQQPILFVAATRSDDVDDTLQGVLWRLEREGRLDTIPLKRLSSQASAALLREMVRTDMDALSARLYEETEGNPLFMVEIVRSLMESGSLAVTGSWPHGPLSLPASVVAVIQARLTRLSPAARELLAAASIFRRDFDFEVVRQVSGQTEDVALDALDELLRSHLVVESAGPSHSLPQPAVDAPTPADDVRYIFSHDKVREVVYNGLSHARRVALHRRAVAALGTPADARTAERAAYHARLGRLWQEGLQWSWAAAEAAKAVFAFATATLLYQQALECWERLPMDDEHVRQGVMLRLHLSRVAFYIYPGQLMQWLLPAEADALRLGDESLLAFVWLAQGSALYIQGEFHAARPRLERLLPLVEKTGDPMQMARTRNILGRLLTLQGHAAEGLPLLADAADRLDAVGAHNDALISRGMMGAERAFQGDFARGLREAEAVYAESLKQADLAAVGAASVFVGAAHCAWGHWAEAEKWSRRALSYVQQAANLVYERNVYLFLGLPLVYQGDLAGGRAALERAIALGGECQSRVFMGRAHAWLAETLLRQGDAARARQEAEQGRDLALATEAHYDLAMAHRVLGQALTALGEWTEAMQELTTAITAFQALGAQPEVGRALAAMARLARARGYDEQAAFWQTEARDLFTRLDMQWDLAQLD
ncbi:MAG: AAA family ATPase [Anaerolineae bacterium]|nr:AAA family ATPase [Anaerolineae bacterium]